ncbi:MAG TPA: DUF1420 family protein [Polyangia bacterium]|jgi:hypothetical protein
MKAHAFLRLQDVVLPPPLPALVELLMVAGIAYLGWRFAVRLRRERVEALDVAAGFVAVTAAAAAVVHGLALAQLSTLGVLRPIGWGLAALGGFALVRHRAAISKTVHREVGTLWRAPLLERAAALIAMLSILALALAALGPPSDADSLDYHLGLALEWLRHGGAYPRLDWYPSRLAGISESLNLLGLAAGTDGLGAGLQFGGMIAAAIALLSCAATPRDRLLAWLLVAGCPTIAFLVPNQKPQMLPAAGTTIAIVMAVRRFDDFRREDAVLALMSAMFAVASKFTFILSAGFVVAVCLAAGRRSRRTGFVFGAAVATFAVLVAPMLLRNLAFYGDPLSPLLERFRAHPNPELTFYSAYLKTMAGELTPRTLLQLPVDMTVTTNPAAYTNILGVGVLAFIPALRLQGRTRLLLWAALGAAIVCVLLGQLVARFFLEPFLWAGAAAVAAGWTVTKRLLLRGLMLQGAVTALVALLGAANLFPGALTGTLRHGVLARSAAGFTEGEWLDQVLPEDAVLLGINRFHLFTPRPFIVCDPATSTKDAARADANLQRLVTEGGVNTLLLDVPNDAFTRLARRCGQLQAGPAQLNLATRNPFNQKQYTIEAFRLRDCQAR